MLAAFVQQRRHLLLAGLVLTVAVLLRVWQLDLKPPHFDEGINGGFTDQMMTLGGYHYDPANYHGPLYFYLLLTSQTLFGHEIAALRLPSVLAGVAVVAIALFGYRRHLGAGASLCLGAFLTVSPAMVFVSRYAIHEMYLLLFLMLATLGFMDRWSGKGGAWLICIGTGGMILTKETYILHLACLGLAWGVWLGLRRIAPDTDASAASDPVQENASESKKRKTTAGWSGFSAPAAVWVAAVLFFYSAGLTYPEGIAGLWRTFAVWTQTGVDAGGHAKPWHYWIELMWRYEWVALAGFVVSTWFLLNGRKAVRIAVIAGAGTLAAYSLVAYKTPWCIVSFLWSGSLALSCLLARFANRGGGAKIAVIVAGLLLAGHDVWSCLRLNWSTYDDEREPYVYVQTSREIERFTGVLSAAAEHDPLTLHRPGVIVADAPFPLPWMLRDHTRLSYFGSEQPLTVAVTTADFVLTRQSRHQEVEALLYDEFWVVELRLRGSHEPMTAYFRARRYDQELMTGPAVLKRFAGPHLPGGEEIVR